MAGSSNNNDLLLDLDDQGRNYGNPGQPALVPEADYPPRPSVSYDEFVGGHPSVYSQTISPLSPATRTYSQTSVLGNYQPYYHDEDMDDMYQNESRPVSDYQYASASEDHHDISGVPSRQNSYGVGSVVGRVKSALGMNPEYSEMDLPLTEARPKSTATVPEAVGGARKRRGSGSKFKFGFGGNKVDPSTLGPRIIHLNNPPANAVNKYVDNHVSTAKYNVATFVPKFLYEQFSKYANLFFLFTAGLQQIPNISPTNRYTTIGPLIVVLLVSAGKELVEDWKRKTQDKELNRSKARVLMGTEFETQRWINVRVGDIIRVESEEPFPADLVLMASSEPEGLCYIETANLDGETNLKIKQAIPETAGLVSTGDLSRLSGRVRSEQPNSSLYTYEATLTIDSGGGEKELPLSPEQLLLRGATLRNTPWIHGIVVFTGHETKLMRNATATPIKRTAVERMLNVQIIMLVSILLILSLVSSTGDVIKQVSFEGPIFIVSLGTRLMFPVVNSKFNNVLSLPTKQ